MAEFYQLLLIPRPGVAPTDVTRELDKAIDWFKLSDSAYVLYTRHDASQWLMRLEPLCRPEGELLIARMDPTDSEGWVPQQFWDWMAANGVGTGTVSESAADATSSR